MGKGWWDGGGVDQVGGGVGEGRVHDMDGNWHSTSWEGPLWLDFCQGCKSLQPNRIQTELFTFVFAACSGLLDGGLQSSVICVNSWS